MLYRKQFQIYTLIYLTYLTVVFNLSREEKVLSFNFIQMFLFSSENSLGVNNQIQCVLFGIQKSFQHKKFIIIEQIQHLKGKTTG